MVSWTANGELLERDGNRSPHAVPHGVFRCADQDGRERWVAIAVDDDVDWGRLVAAIGAPAWATDPPLAAFSGRRERVDEVERGLEAWTRTRSASDVASTLQAAGVDAGAVADLGDTHDDPQLVHRRHFRRVTHPLLGDYPAETNAIRSPTLEPSIRSGAPCLGADTDAVLESLGGYATDEIARLRAAGVLE